MSRSRHVCSPAQVVRGRRRRPNICEGLLEFAADARKRGVPPDRVARAVEHALTARRPRPRYPVGIDARMGILLRWLLPDRAMDWLLARMF